MLLKTKLFFLRKCSLCSYLNNEQPPKIFLAFLWAHLLNENSSNLIFFILLCKCFVHNSLCFFTCSVSVFHSLTFIEYVLFSRCKGRSVLFMEGSKGEEERHRKRGRKRREKGKRQTLAESPSLGKLASPQGL